MCIRRQEGCYLSKWPQSLKNSTCATQWSVPCPPLHHTKAPHPPCQPRENRSCHICQWALGIFVLLDLFTSFFPIHLPVNDHVTFYSRQPHTSCTRADEAFPSRDTSPASYAPWLHHQNGVLEEIICLSVNVEKSNMPTEHTKDWKSALGCRQSSRCWLLGMEL